MMTGRLTPPPGEPEPGAAHIVQEIIDYALNAQADNPERTIERALGARHILAAAEDGIKIALAEANRGTGPGKVAMRKLADPMGLALDTVRNWVWDGAEAKVERVMGRKRRPKRRPA